MTDQEIIARFDSLAADIKIDKADIKAEIKGTRRCTLTWAM